MNLKDKIKVRLSENKQTYNEFCTFIEMSRTGADKMIETGTIKIATLEKMCTFLKVPTSFFIDFSENNVENKQNSTNTEKSIENSSITKEFINSLQEQIKFLQGELKSKNEDLDFFKRIVSQKLGMGDKELAKYRTNEQGILDREVCGRFGFVSGGVREVEVLPSVAAGSVSEVR